MKVRNGLFSSPPRQHKTCCCGTTGMLSTCHIPPSCLLYIALQSSQIFSPTPPPPPHITDGFREIKIWTSWKSFNMKSQETNNSHHIRGCSNKIPNFQFPHWPVAVEGHVTWHFPIGYILRGLLQLEDLEVHTATFVWHNEVRVNGTHGTACLLTATHASHEHYWVGQWDSLPAHCNTRIIIT